MRLEPPLYTHPRTLIYVSFPEHRRLSINSNQLTPFCSTASQETAHSVEFRQPEPIINPEKMLQAPINWPLFPVPFYMTKECSENKHITRCSAGKNRCPMDGCLIRGGLVHLAGAATCRGRLPPLKNECDPRQA